MNSKEKVKTFWSDQAMKTDVHRVESLVNFQTDRKTLDEYLEKEFMVINNELRLSKNDILVDLGAGNGRFTFAFAPKVYKVIAIEFINTFATYIMTEAKARGIKNIEVINASAEDYCIDNSADVIFVSGLLNYLDSSQYNQTLHNISKTIRNKGFLFMRETISMFEHEFIVDKYSEELKAHYYSIYRTGEQHINAFNELGFKLIKYAPFFEDGSKLNKRLETRLYYFIFKYERKTL